MPVPPRPALSPATTGPTGPVAAPARRAALGSGLARAVLATGLARALLDGTPARAQGTAAKGAAAGWPSRPLRLIIPYAAGGVSDAAARLFAEHLAPALGQPVVVENRGGAGGIKGMEALAQAGDGHTIAFSAVSPITLQPYLMAVPYAPATDFVAVAPVMYSPVYVLATSAFKGDRFEDVLTQARARPGKLTFASSGIGSVGNLMLEQIKRNANVDLIHVPYKGGSQIMTDAVGGHFDLMTANPSPNLNALVANGRLRLLAVTGPARLPAHAAVPTLAELGLPQANMTSIFGFFAPARTPAEVVQRLDGEIGRILARQDVKDKLTQLDNVVAPGSAAQFGKLLKDEAAANERVIREAGIKLE